MMSTGDRVFNIVNYSLLIVLSFIFLFPFWRVIMISFNDGLDSIRGGINFWFRDFTLDNYAIIFARDELWSAYGITIMRTVFGTVASLFLMSMMGYALSKAYIKGRKVINFFLLITMFFSGGLVPSYLLFKQLGILNTPWMYFVPMLYSAYSVFIFRTFFRTLPSELEEAAAIDGAGSGTIFFRLILPMSKPILATMALFSAIGHWNDYMTAILYTSNRDIQPLQTFLYRILNEAKTANQIAMGSQTVLSQSAALRITPLAVQMAALVVSVAPIMCIYPFLQKYFVKGVMIGSLKG